MSSFGGAGGLHEDRNNLLSLLRSNLVDEAFDVSFVVRKFVSSVIEDFRDLRRLVDDALGLLNTNSLDELFNLRRVGRVRCLEAIVDAAAERTDGT